MLARELLARVALGALEREARPDLVDRPGLALVAGGVALGIEPDDLFVHLEQRQPVARGPVRGREGPRLAGDALALLGSGIRELVAG